jgi:hypothetical protein
MAKRTTIPFPINASFPTFTQKTTSADVVIWVDYTNGSDNNPGTVDLPVRHLRVGMDLARNYIPLEDAIIYVRLKAGQHALDNQAVDLYHPYGDKVIVEGDPAAFRQRLVWGVDEYTWSIANFMGGGHTGTVRLFDAGNTAAASASPGVTLHGFTATNVGQFFCITNGEQGPRGGFIMNSTNDYNSDAGFRITSGIRDEGNYLGSPPRHSFTRVGDAFFNHGISFEDANSILGIGRIRDASSAATLGVEFRNLNIDSRVPAVHLNGGRNNSTAWGGISNNYPSSQYGDPVGFYGQRGALNIAVPWKSAGGVAYPVIGDLPAAAQQQRTDAPFTLSTYPVSIRGRFTASSMDKLVLRKGKLRALRNIMFTSNILPHVSNDASNTTSISPLGLSFSDAADGGATSGYLGALSSLVTGYGGEGGYGVDIASPLMLENAEVGIRHLGFANVGVGVVAHNSTIRAYNSVTIHTDLNAPTISRNRLNYTVMGSLDNAPVICTSNCDTGMHLVSCDVDLDDPVGGVCTNHYSCRDHTVRLHGKRTALYARNTVFKAGTVVLDNTSLPLNFFAFVAPDSYTGLASSVGETRANWITGTDITEYKYATLSYQLPGDTRRVIGVLTDTQNVLRSGSYPNYGAGFFGVSGSTAGATPVGGIAATNFGYFAAHVLPVVDAGGGFSFAEATSLNSAQSEHQLSTGNAFTRLLNLGGTLSCQWYYDLAGTSLASEWITDKACVFVKGANGVTLGYTGLTMPTALASAGVIPSWYIYYYGSMGEESPGWAYSRNRKVGKNALCLDSSKMVVYRGMWVENGGYDAILVENDSSLIIGNHFQNHDYPGYDHHQFSHMHHNSVHLQTNTPDGYLCITGYDHCAVRVRKGSKFTANHLFVKHGSYSPYSYSYTSYSRAPRFLFAEQGSAVVLGTLVGVAYPSHNGTTILPVADAANMTPNRGLWTTFNGTLTDPSIYASKGQLISATTQLGMVRATSGSSIVFKQAAVDGSGERRVIFHMDGGTADFKDVRNLSLFSVAGGGHIVLPTLNSMLYNIDERPPADRRIHTRSLGTAVTSGIYNSEDQAFAENRRWTGAYYAGSAIPANLVHRRVVPEIGASTYFGAGGTPVAAGITHCVRVEDQYSAITIQPLINGYS